MARKLTYKYHMDFESKQHLAAPALMGGAFFLRTVYYFGFTRPENAGVWNLLIFLILPMALEAAFMVMLRGIRLDLPGVYGIMGAVYCVLLLLQCFQSGDLLRIILGSLAYLCCGAAVVGSGWGLLSKSLTLAVLIVTVAVRFFVFDLSGYVFKLRLIPFIREAAAVCGLLALVFLIAGMKDRKNK